LRNGLPRNHPRGAFFFCAWQGALIWRRKSSTQPTSASVSGRQRRLGRLRVGRKPEAKRWRDEQEADRYGIVGLGVNINPQKTRIVHIQNGFEFLGYKIKRGGRPLRLPNSKLKSGSTAGALYAISREKSVRLFKDQIRGLTRRRAPVTTDELIQQINPVLRGWGRVLQARPCPTALQPAQPLDRATPLVASIPALTLLRVANAAPTLAGTINEPLLRDGSTTLS
jgi:hypothetical protein